MRQGEATCQELDEEGKPHQVVTTADWASSLRHERLLHRSGSSILSARVDADGRSSMAARCDESQAPNLDR